MNDARPDEWIVSLEDPRAADVARCGGKVAGLRGLIEAGLPVPPGFCVTTDAFAHAVADRDDVRDALEALDALDSRDRGETQRAASRVRELVLACPIEPALVAQLGAAFDRVTAGAPVAVRSSATAEDLASASFAGQQDTVLDVRDDAALLAALRQCWASLYGERAVSYRRAHGLASRGVSMAVLVQRMVHADAAGVLFTADPLRGRRDVFVIEAVRGLGDALVSGRASPQRYTVAGDARTVLERRDGDREITDDSQAILTPTALASLASMGARARERAGAPQDLEWARESDALWLVQSRAITTLWPLPEGPSPSEGLRVYLSFGHIQMNTAALSRPATSMFQRVIPIGREGPDGVSQLVRVAADRLFVDVTAPLAHPVMGRLFPAAITNMSASLGQRLAVARGRLDGVAPFEGLNFSGGDVLRQVARLGLRVGRNLRGDVRERRDAYVAGLYAQLARQRARTEGLARVGDKLDAVLDELGTQADWMLARGAFPLLLPVLLTTRALERIVPRLKPGASFWTLLEGLDGSITTEMNLALGDLADLARETPALVEALQREDPRAALEALCGDPSCADFFTAWQQFLSRHGHRCAGEIDPALPRWSEDPRVPLKSIAGLLDRPRGALRAQHASLAREALALRDELVHRARRGLFGPLRASLVARVIDRTRTLHAVREEHKFVMMHTVTWMRAVLLEAGARLVAAGTFESPDEVWLFDLYELRALVHAVERGEHRDVRATVRARREAHAQYASMQPPAVYTSLGETITLPPSPSTRDDVLVGTAVSAGVYEGFARVLFDPNAETLSPGEILVTRYTDPGWTPLFGHAGALVMEVGGQMTHGSVVARELGIAAVVAVENATSILRTGDRLRVDGERGEVTVLARART